LVLAATANARPIRIETLKLSPPRMETPIATAPSPRTAIRATLISSFSSAWPLRTTLVHRSCAIAPEAMTRPATTARIVAKATALDGGHEEITPVVPFPPPSSSASRVAAGLPPAPASTAPCPRIALASGTVKKRTRMCGSPAVPSRSARPNEIPLIASEFPRPGAR